MYHFYRPKAATRKSKKKAASNCANGANENEDAIQQQPLVPRDVYGYNAEQQIIDARNGTLNANSIQEVLNNDQVVNRMRTMFESSLQLHATGQHMQVKKFGSQLGKYLFVMILLQHL